MTHAKKFGIDLYCTQETAENLSLDKYKKIRAQETFEIKEFKITPFITHHDTPGSVGFFISDKTDNLLFATDTNGINYTFPDLTNIIIECN